MKILLRKVTHSPSEFEVKRDKITFKGYLEYHNRKLVLLHAKLSGEIDKPCDICAEDMKVKVDEEVEFFISEGIYDEDDEIAVDVIESFDGYADIDELLHSEIELVKNDYHSCGRCDTILN